MRRKHHTALRDLAVLRRCDDRELDRIATAATERIASPGQVLCRAGDVADRAYVVVDGAVDVVVAGASVVSLGPGSIAGEQGVLSGGVRNADLVVEQPARLLELPAATLRVLLAECQGLRRTMTPLLAERADLAAARAAG